MILIPERCGGRGTTLMLSFGSRDRDLNQIRAEMFRVKRETHSCNTTADPPPRLHTHQWLLQNLPAGRDKSV